MSPIGQQTRRSSDPPSGGRPPTGGKPASGKGSAQAKIPPRRTWLWFLVILVINYLLVRLLIPGPEAPTTVPYTFFKEQVSKGNVQAINSQGEAITGSFITPVTYSPVQEGAAAGKGTAGTGNERATGAEEGPKTVKSFKIWQG